VGVDEPYGIVDGQELEQDCHRDYRRTCQNEMAALAQQLKKLCGSGGTLKSRTRSCDPTPRGTR
jgi:hypothetical protein